MAKGQKAAVLCALGDNLIYTVPVATNDKINIRISSVDGTAVVVKVYHVKQGNNGTIPIADRFLITTPFTVENDTVIVEALNVSSLDDIVVNSSVADKAVVNVNGET